MNLMNSRILCVFAHPDDESYIVGGTLAHASAHGAEIHLVSATRGDKGVQHVEDPAEKERITHIREQELGNACKVLGIKTFEVWDFPDGSLDNLGAREETLNEKIITTIETVKPDTIITFGPNGVSRHRDHIAIGKMTIKTVQQFFCHPERERSEQSKDHPHMRVPAVYGVTIPRELIGEFERILSARKKTTGHYYEMPLNDSPSLNDVERIDITSTLSTKFAACRAHASQNPEGLIASFEQLPLKLKNFEYFLPLKNLEN